MRFVVQNATGLNIFDSEVLKVLQGTGITYTVTQETNGDVVLTITSSGGSGLSDGDYGDVTVSGVGTVITIDNDAVTYAKIQDVSATDRILGRDTAAAGIIEELTVTGGLEFTGTGIQRSALTGDVTASAGSNTTAIAADAVTNAQLANMAALTIKGNESIGSANPTDLSMASVASLLAAYIEDLRYNYLINGQMWLFQRQTPGTGTARTDDTYGPDRFNVLTQTAAVNCERSTGDTGSQYAVKITQTQASAQRLGIMQIVQGGPSFSLRSQIVTMCSRIKCSASQAIKVAILEWTGTLDTVTSDVVNDWTSSTYTAGNFFLAASLTVTNVDTVTPSAATWTDLNLTGALSSSCNNAIVLIWTEGTAAQNVTLEVCQWGLYRGVNNEQTWNPRPNELELTLAQAYYQKSYAVDILPGTAWTVGTDQILASGSSGLLFHGFALPVRMRTAPTLVVYDAAGTASKISTFVSGAWGNNSTLSTSYAGEAYVQVGTATASALISNYAYTLNAEL